MRQVVDFDRGDPFDPPEATGVGHDEACRMAVSGVEGLASEASREDHLARVVDRKAAIVAGGRCHVDAGAGRLSDEPIQPCAGPLLSRLETARAIEGRGHPIVEFDELFVSPLAAACPQPPRALLEIGNRIQEP